jgi:small conductance mechanosensitive channel
MDWQQIIDTATVELTAFGLKVAGAIAVWIVGRYLIHFAVRLVSAALTRQHVDPTILRYLGNIITVTLNIILVIAILGYFGVETTSFAALVAGIEGTVREIGLFATTIMTPDNVSAFVGNNKIFGDSIFNYSSSQYRRVDRLAQLAHGVNAKEAIARLKEALGKVPNVVATPVPDVEIVDFNERGTLLAVRPYTHTDHYWQVYFDTNRAIADTFGAAGYPVPESHVRMKQMA